MAMTLYRKSSKSINVNGETLTKETKLGIGNYVIVPIETDAYVYYSTDGSSWYRATYYNTPEVFNSEVWISYAFSNASSKDIEITELPKYSAVASAN